MDYIIFGIGTSASLVLVGWLLRDWGPRLRDRNPAEDDILSASQLVTRMAWARFCAACGMALVLCGVLVMLATIVVMFVGPGDRVASIAVISVFSTAALLMLIWTGLFARQFGTTGVFRPVEKTAPEPTPVAAAATEVTETDAIPVVVDGQHVETPEPEPSFAEAAAAPGGLGRFAGFLRRDVPEAPVQTTPGDAVNAEGTPTDSAIAELHGESQDTDSKKLSEHDPLVTSVRAEIAAIDGLAADSDAVAATDLDGSGTSESATSGENVTGTSNRDDAQTSAAPEVADLESESPPGDRPDHELALDSLRKRRLGRLANKHDPD